MENIEPVVSKQLLTAGSEDTIFIKSSPCEPTPTATKYYSGKYLQEQDLSKIF